MSQEVEVKVPDIGDFSDVPVIEILVKPGDAVAPEDPLVSLESDKATMEVPSPAAGKVKAIQAKVGDKVSQGSLLLTLENDEAKADRPLQPDQGATTKSAANATSDARSSAAEPPSAKTTGDAPPATGAAAGASPSPARTSAATTKPAGPAAVTASAEADTSSPSPTSAGATLIKVPDIGDFSDVPVIEILVKVGDLVKPEDALVTLESDKATMDIPSPAAGTIKEVKVKVGDKVSEGAELLLLEPEAVAAPAPPASTQSAVPTPTTTGEAPAPSPPSDDRPPSGPDRAAVVTPFPTGGEAPVYPNPPVDADAFRKAHASPSVRAFARKLGVDLSKVKGSGPKERIVEEDVQNHVKQLISRPGMTTAAGATAGGAGLDLLPWPKVDFAKFGPVEPKPLSRIKKISGANLHRNWVMIPHVTNHDDADITELEAFRVALNKENEKSGIKITMLAFLIKACVAALTKFPELNASLDSDNLVYKRYFHIGFAADTPNGLVVPVVKNADQKGVLAIAKETAELAAKARDGKLGPTDMQGGSFSISSLGGIGGTYFTPIINAPEVAILGVCRSTLRPVWTGKEFSPRLILPLSLSYDHRVIDGATAARFNGFLASLLADMRRSML